MGRKREGTFRKIMGSILYTLPGAGKGVDWGKGVQERRVVTFQHSLVL